MIRLLLILSFYARYMHVVHVIELHTYNYHEKQISDLVVIVYYYLVIHYHNIIDVQCKISENFGWSQW